MVDFVFKSPIIFMLIKTRYLFIYSSGKMKKIKPFVFFRKVGTFLTKQNLFGFIFLYELLISLCKVKHLFCRQKMLDD